MEKTDFVVNSLELHLFFARIMKEHSLFLESGFTPMDSEFAAKADSFKKRFEELLFRAVRLSDGIVSKKVLFSGEIVTNFTLESEKNTERLSGIKINQEITKQELRLKAGKNSCIDCCTFKKVEELNKDVLDALNGLIRFKEAVLEKVLSCRLFTFNYPLLIEHILREARLYREQLLALINNCDFKTSVRETELFWDRIMMEHALFIRGLLDPTESELIKQANDFANDFRQLILKTNAANDKAFKCITEKTLMETKAIRDFKQAGTIGLNTCAIRSIILPLLADHVLREANHFIRILKEFENLR